jgi:4-methyl-5(b-hydroxyethyl)-thiazole monophosphate biosynthesis
MTVYLFLADGFEEIEAIAPIDIFRRGGVEVTTVSVSGRKMVTGSHGIAVQADVLFEETGFTGEYLLFLPGGGQGTAYLDAHEGLHALLDKQVANGGLVAAICAAPSILGKKGILKGHEAICYPGFEHQLEGAMLSDQKVVRSGNIFTAKAAGVAVVFALYILSEIKGSATANKVGGSIYIA